VSFLVHDRDVIAIPVALFHIKLYVAYTLSTENGQFKDLASSAETPEVVAQAQERPVSPRTHSACSAQNCSKSWMLSNPIFAYKPTLFVAVSLHSRSRRTQDLPSYPELHHNVPWLHSVNCELAAIIPCYGAGRACSTLSANLAILYSICDSTFPKELLTSVLIPPGYRSIAS
jgi:hypothetical protein